MTDVAAQPRQISLPAGEYAYLDVGEGQPIVALHGHFGRASIFAPVAVDIGCRILALDQRGHGHSPSDGDFRLDSYVDDAAAFIAALDLAPVPVLGHSMGGLVAYRLAARYPELVRVLLIEDATVRNDAPTVPNPVLDLSDWPRRAPTRDALATAIEERGIPSGYFMHSAAEFADGWGLLFDYADMVDSQRAHLGDYWSDWLASSCPALLLHGKHSTILASELAREMAGARPNTTLREFADCGHWIHDDDPAGFAAAIRDYLGTDCLDSVAAS
ncbi:pimeloyl-ACP methyl ester carboxylesterase [Tamaricihabitans halophyticus]|uniref:Pimeloyl-ACP methyl ester carboxylesterase n=1 Tax=Tamaricihabitans halophyticus TaxID=1262583 RepID=A0A4R2R3P4_9PSEU|nr:alpha/beta hydrolase [Tamaricihabitans halophyticus]TCP54151.1 pimeloyl-ACP methyl ester carboxylesterase [Tamaricihabitans halophyticus]